MGLLAWLPKLCQSHGQCWKSGGKPGENVRTCCLGMHSFNRKTLCSEFPGPILVMLFEDNTVCVYTSREGNEGNGRGEEQRRACVTYKKILCILDKLR